MDIIIRIIPHDKQRYPTVGDWYFTSNYKRLNIFISDVGDWRKNLLVSVHELIEASLCRDRNIKEVDVTQFDIIFEAQRKPDDTSEPGDHADAPYKKEHFFATNIERLLAAELKIDWSQYEEAINNL